MILNPLHKIFKLLMQMNDSNQTLKILTRIEELDEE